MDDSFPAICFLLVLVLDPFGNIPLVAALLRAVPADRRRRVVLRECLIAYGVLLAFLLFGGYLMGFLGLSQTSLGIAGGVLLLLIALRMIFPAPGGLLGDDLQGEPMVFPLAIPAIAGPSAMAVVMLLASREPARLWEWSAALTLAMAVSTTTLLAGARLAELAGERGRRAMERLTGLLLSILAVEMLLRGIEDFVRTLTPV